MKLPVALLVIALFAGSIALADTAEASSLNPAASAAGNISTYWVQVQDPGHYHTVAQQVWHPAEVIGYDYYGNAIVRPGHYDTVYRRVWVPGRVRWVFIG